jgi:hypothetical protein
MRKPPRKLQWKRNGNVCADDTDVVETFLIRNTIFVYFFLILFSFFAEPTLPKQKYSVFIPYFNMQLNGR